MGSESREKRVARELLRLAQSVVGDETPSRQRSAARWKEFDDSKGHRWTQDNDSHLWHITEIEGPGVPLYRLAVLVDDVEGFEKADAFKHKKQFKSLKEAQRVAAKWTKILEDDNAASIDLRREFVTI